MTPENGHRFPELPFTPEMADSYLDEVRSLYRDGEADYRGQRSPKQQELAANAAREADSYFDESLLGVLAMGAWDEEQFIEVIPTGEKGQEITLGDVNNAVTLNEMRTSWRQLWTGMTVMTNRLTRSTHFVKKGLREVSQLNPAAKRTVMQMLFNQFQDINALRFGVEASGVDWVRRVHDIEQGTIVERRFDPDKSLHDREVSKTAARRRYNARRGTRPAVHAAGKLSPRELRDLRKEFSEIEPDMFFFETGFRKNAIAALRGEDDETDE
jgi:hypothetical protein